MSRASLPVLLPSISQTLVDKLCRPSAGRVGAICELWRRLVVRELNWCADHVDTLAPRHRQNACSLVDWYHREFGVTLSAWLVLYPSQSEMYRRQSVAELDWASANVSELTIRHRMRAIELMQDVWDECKIYHSCWSVLLDL